jgi:hypothetical protein
VSDVPRRPPPWLLRAINPFVRPMLGSPLHPLVSRRLMLLEYRGRTSGRTYTIPVGYVAWGDDEVVAFTSRRWWTNLRDGRPVRVRLRGRWRRADPAVEGSLEERVATIQDLVRRFGPRAGRPFFLGLPCDRPPTPEEARWAAEATMTVRFRLGET